jgi:ligand-binding sensor protein
MKFDLKDILTKDFIERFQDSFAFATGFGVVFVDLEGNHIGEGSNFSIYCRKINETKEGAAYCASTNRKAIDIAIKTNKPSIYICHAGLVNIEIPLTYEGEYIGAVTAGQVLCSDGYIYPKDSVIRTLPWMESDEAKEFFRNVKTLTRQQIEATAVSLENIANYIIQMTMYNKLQERLVEEQRRRLQYEKRQIEMEHQLKVAELDALQKQVTPHFIFNVINSISRLISMEKYDSAKNMLDSFSRMLRYSLYDINTNITLKQELNYIENYLKIQKNRFGDRLEYEIITDHNLDDMSIPYFSLQPLVENAIEHGLLPLECGGLLKIICKCENDVARIEIIDDGVGISPEKLREIRDILRRGNNYQGTSHVGMRNCYRRLMLMFEDRLSFTIDSSIDTGTKVSISIRRA